MKYYEAYAPVYESKLKKGEIHFTPNQSLIEFFNQDVKNRHQTDICKILELGSGPGSIFNEMNQSNYEILGVDLSPAAIQYAKENNIHKNISFECLDVLKMNFESSFDVIVDSHFFHCLTDSNDRVKALSNIYKALKKDGLFVLETMTSHKKMEFDGPYRFDEIENTLYQQNTSAQFSDLKFFEGHPYLPVRKINHAIEIENEIIQSGFEIIFLYIYGNRKIIPNDFRETALETDPDLLRLIAKK